jgi:hypothetical protein
MRNLAVRGPLRISRAWSRTARAGSLPHPRTGDASDQKGRSHARAVAVRPTPAAALASCHTDDEVAPSWVAAMARPCPGTTSCPGPSGLVSAPSHADAGARRALWRAA